MIQKIYENSGFILAFLITILFVQLVAGKKMTTTLLGLILLSQIVLNPEIIDALKFEPSDKQPKKTSNTGGVILL